MILAMRSMRLGFLFLTSILLASLPVAAQTPTGTAAPTGWHVTVPAEGGLIFQMKVDGQGPYRTVFDTGAVNVMSANFAQQLGLRIDEKTIDFGAIGGGVKARTVYVDTLTIGELNIRNQTFYILDIPSDASTPQMLVGWEFMQMFAVQIDFKRNEITFFEGTHFHYPGKGEAVPLLHTNGNRIDVEAKVDGIKGRFLVDSGNQTGTFLSSAFVTQNDLVQKLNAHYRGYNGRGFGGDSPPAWYVRLHSFQVGKLKIEGPITRLQTANDSFNDKLAGNIGQDILNRFIVTVDCKHAVMYLEKTPLWNKPASFNRSGMLVDYNHDSDEIKTVFPDSPAEAAGLRQGDRILTINGTKPSDDPNDPLFKQPVGTVLYLQVQRGEISQTYDVTLRDVL
jgi:aspartyl protease/PDZ domain-containing protein